MEDRFPSLLLTRSFVFDLSFAICTHDPRTHSRVSVQDKVPGCAIPSLDSPIIGTGI